MITILLVRHADIDLPPVSADPPLNEAGRRRAEALAHLLGAAGVSTVFTSAFRRTRETVEPLKMASREMPSAATVAHEARAGRYGAVVLIAGHSNTVPEVIAALGAPPPAIGETDFDNLFVVTTADDAEPGLLRLKYGISLS
ncbi:phosphoglycerate mutase [Actinoplanes sp. SE50]|uniref:phosphoglycerate mutase family protein n=1 Tax=unclassified Actinoplanes TaxID=2626549 RepID=UPI00023EC0AC|nr:MULTISPECIES: phosphoglycerate mutase family protein [unclassified Actinoplanes]AEV83536.1 phosphoglycerate mutase [Actinoplanes sp. SE50/110]ATO82320.1 phosphoglycerate mutase [Actinoplanes sp. SE50]SLL99727.1 phosphoglycerate mutase [Actinoplanes sp. SE50/110]